MLKRIKLPLFCLTLIVIALLIFGCSGKSKDDQDLALMATMQAQQATIQAMEGSQKQEAPPAEVEAPKEVAPPAEEAEGAEQPAEEGGAPDLQATMDAQKATNTALQAQEDEKYADVPEINLQTDFSGDDGIFSLSKKMVIEDDGLFMGEFEKCADFSLEIDQPVGCIAICQACGVVSDFDERVEITYDDGYVDKMFGLVLRFDDKNGNNMIDRDDYFLGWAYNAYPQPNASYLFEHIPMDFAGWKAYGPFPRHLRGKQDKPSIIRVTSWNGGSRIIIYMNDSIVAKIQNEEKIAGKNDEIFLGERKEISKNWEGMPNQGKIGFWVAEWKIRLKYDNFSFINRSEEPVDW